MVAVLVKMRHSYAASKSLLQPWVIIGTNGTVEVAQLHLHGWVGLNLLTHWCNSSLGGNCCAYS